MSKIVAVRRKRVVRIHRPGGRDVTVAAVRTVAVKVTRAPKRP